MIHDFDNSKPTITYQYKFVFKDGSNFKFNLQLEKETCELIEPSDETYPEWAKLRNYKCENCPLDEKEEPFCPVAVSISDLIDFIGDYYSFEEVFVEVKTQNRTYSAETTLQKGVSSLLGLYMTTSGCPVLSKLKPLARYHLPFATLGETSFRSVSMYMVSQYFVYKNGGTPDFELKKLVNIYDEIHKVNISLKERLSHLNYKDAGVNALLILDNSGTYVHFKIDEDLLKDVDLLCKKYFD